MAKRGSPEHLKRLVPGLGLANTVLPEDLFAPHAVCLREHDMLLRLLHSGFDGEAYMQTLPLDEEDKKALAAFEHPLEWVLETRSEEVQALFLSRTVFPALLGDLLHFVFEALQSGRKGKMTVAFALLRKPLYDSLALLETIATEPEVFARRLKSKPRSLSASFAGGLPVHTRRVEKAITALNDEELFSATYIARLRYDHKHDDSFAGPCDQSLHLITTRPGIETDPLNLNFVFTDQDALFTQWSFFYSRLPYLLFYLRRLTEHVHARFIATDPEYLADMERRSMAGLLLARRAVAPGYLSDELEVLFDGCEQRLRTECKKAGRRFPSEAGLWRMVERGAFPGESAARVRLRELRYGVLSKVGRALARSAQTSDDEDPDKLTLGL